MRKLNQAGSLLVPFILVFLLFLGAAGFGGWAYLGRQDYKNNSDVKSAEAVKKAIVVEAAKKDAAFAEVEKNPLKTYRGPSTFGSISFDYPKTWSAYISENGNGQAPVNGWFSPNYVPDVQNSGVAYALRVQVLNATYARTLAGYDSYVKTGKVSVVPFTAAKVPGTLGALVSGILEPSRANTNQLMVILPVRDKTILIWTEGPDYVNDFNKIVMPSFNYQP